MSHESEPLIEIERFSAQARGWLSENWREWQLAVAQKEKVDAFRKRFPSPPYLLTTLIKIPNFLRLGGGKSHARLLRDPSNRLRLAILSLKLEEGDLQAPTGRWNHSEIRRLAGEIEAKVALFFPPGSPEGRRLEARTSLQQMIAHRVTRWLTGLLAGEDHRPLEPVADRVDAIFRLLKTAGKDEVPNSSGAGAPIEPHEVRSWLGGIAQAAVCRLQGSVPPYNAWFSGQLTVDLAVDDLLAGTGKYFLYILPEEPGLTWEALLCVRGDGSAYPRDARTLSEPEISVAVALLRFLWSLVPGLYEPQPAMTVSDSEVCKFFRRNKNDEPLADLALQLAGLPDAVLRVSPGAWYGCAVMALDTLPVRMKAATRRSLRGPEQLHLVAAQENYPTPHSTMDIVSGYVSARAYREQLTVIEPNPTDSTVMNFLAEGATFALGIPMGLAEYEGAKGVLYLYSRQDIDGIRRAETTIISMETLAGLIGEMMAAYYGQERMLSEAYQVISRPTGTDRLTRWANKEAMEQRLRTPGIESLPLIMLHLSFPHPLDSVDMASALRRIAEGLDRWSVTTLQGRLGVQPSAQRVRPFEVYALGREEYAIEILGENLRPVEFYLAKTELARELRSINLGARAEWEYFVWVRAAVASAPLTAGSSGAADRLLTEQQENFRRVRQWLQQVASGNFDAALYSLPALEAASPTGRMGWSIPDPALVQEHAHILTLRASSSGESGDLEQAISLFESVPNECRQTGTFCREYLFALKKHVELALWEYWTGDDRSDQALEAVKERAITRSNSVAEIVETVSRAGMRIPRNTRREVTRLAAEVQYLVTRISQLPSSTGRVGQLPAS